MTGLSGSRFGHGVAIDGDLALIGAPDADLGGTPGVGHVQIWRRSGPGAWAVQSTMHGPQPTTGADYGHAVALDGGRAVVGEPGFNGDDGRLVTYAKAGHAAFALDSTISPNRAIAGAPDYDGFIGPVVDRGGVIIYERNGVVYDPAELVGGRAIGEHLGSSTAIWNDTTYLAGAPGYATLTGQERGAVWRGDLLPNQTVDAGYLFSSSSVDERLGEGLAVTAGFAIAGAPFASAGALDEGALYPFDLSIDADGEFVVPVVMPTNVPSGFSFHFQYWIQDPNDASSWIGSNGVTGTVP